MAREEKVFVSWVAPSLNRVYAGVHWRTRKAWADEGHLAVKAAVGRSLKKFDSPVSLEFTPIRGAGKKKAYDISNYALTIKIIEDGLVWCGVLVDDTNKWVRRVITNAPIKGEETGMVVVIKEIEEG